MFDAAGKKSDISIPAAWSPKDVAKKLTGHLVFLKVPKNSGTFAVGYDEKEVHVTGPAVLLITTEENGNAYHVGDWLPETDSEAHELWKETAGKYK